MPDKVLLKSWAQKQCLSSLSLSPFLLLRWNSKMKSFFGVCLVVVFCFGMFIGSQSEEDTEDNTGIYIVTLKEARASKRHPHQQRSVNHDSLNEDSERLRVHKPIRCVSFLFLVADTVFTLQDFVFNYLKGQLSVYYFSKFAISIQLKIL